LTAQPLDDCLIQPLLEEAFARCPADRRGGMEHRELDRLVQHPLTFRARITHDLSLERHCADPY
jgi:hypothetical protein